jgi:DNA polymerase
VRVHLDIETRSAGDLRKIGVYAYAEHPTTEITMAAYGFDGGPRKIWYPPITTRPGSPMPSDLAAALADPDVTIVAHNAAFERIVTAGRVGFPRLPAERFDCTAARAAHIGLPRSLDGAAAAIGLDVQKDKEGHALMLRMSKPRKPRKGEPRDALLWVDDDESMDREGLYCLNDVAVEQALDAAVPPLPPDERETWLLTEEMNDRGIMLDGELLLAVRLLVEDAEAELMDRMFDLTGERFTSLHHAYITKWLAGLGFDDLAADGVGKAAVAAMLERSDLDPLVKQVMLLRQEGGGTASKKYVAATNRMSLDGAIRGALVYCGAVATHRWSSRGLQLQNLLRMLLLKKLARLTACIRDVKSGAKPGEVAELYGPPMVIAGELLRPSLIARPGYWLARGDSKQIEARVGPWLAGAEWKLDAFRRYDAGTGPDLYKVAAAGIYRISPDDIGDEDPRRQIGKVSELALGFQGGAGALQAMAKGYGIKIPRHAGDDVPADGTDEWIKQQWRAANPEFSDRDTGIWKRLERGALACMDAPPGTVVPVGLLSFRRNSKCMIMRLPSGGSLVYWSPRVSERDTPWGTKQRVVIYRGEDSVTTQWLEFAAYGGLWFENAVQATARELMAFWLRRLRKLPGCHPVLTVHDEGVAEMLRSTYPLPDQAAAAIEREMKVTPSWAAGLPVNADSSAGLRYVKA